MSKYFKLFIGCSVWIEENHCIYEPYPVHTQWHEDNKDIRDSKQASAWMCCNGLQIYLWSQMWGIYVRAAKS